MDAQQGNSHNAAQSAVSQKDKSQEYFPILLTSMLTFILHPASSATLGRQVARAHPSPCWMRKDQTPALTCVQVRCDRKLPACDRCGSFGLACPGYGGDRAGHGPKSQASSDSRALDDACREAGVDRRRVGACRECRKLKMKCDRARPRCLRCQTRNLPCTYWQGKTTARSQQSGDSPASMHSSSQLSDQIHDTPMTDEAGGLHSLSSSPLGVAGSSPSSSMRIDDTW